MMIAHYCLSLIKPLAWKKDYRRLFAGNFRNACFCDMSFCFVSWKTWWNHFRGDDRTLLTIIDRWSNRRREQKDYRRVLVGNLKEKSYFFPFVVSLPIYDFALFYREHDNISLAVRVKMLASDINNKIYYICMKSICFCWLCFFFVLLLFPYIHPPGSKYITVR